MWESNGLSFSAFVAILYPIETTIFLWKYLTYTVILKKKKIGNVWFFSTVWWYLVIWSVTKTRERKREKSVLRISRQQNNFIIWNNLFSSSNYIVQARSLQLMILSDRGAGGSLTLLPVVESNWFFSGYRVTRFCLEMKRQTHWLEPGQEMWFRKVSMSDNERHMKRLYKKNASLRKKKNYG